MRSVGDTRTPGLIPLSVSGGRVNAARAVDARRPPLSPNGPGGTWVSCDVDHDGVALSDQCPDRVRARTPDGCPDADADGVRDNRDNCTTTPNLAQADDDGDGVGNACDVRPRGEDPDGDGKPNLDDRCPTVYGTQADGCPDVVVATDGDAHPVTSRGSVVAGHSGQGRRQGDAETCPRGRKTCPKAANVIVRLTRSATASLRFEQRVKRGRRTSWKVYRTRSMQATASARTYTLNGLKPGSYRVKVTVGGKGKTKNFTVR